MFTDRIALLQVRTAVQCSIPILTVVTTTIQGMNEGRKQGNKIQRINERTNERMNECDDVAIDDEDTGRALIT